MTEWDEDTDPSGTRLATNADLAELAKGTTDEELLLRARELFADVVQFQEGHFFMGRRLDALADRLRALIAELKTRRGL